MRENEEWHISSLKMKSSFVYKKLKEWGFCELLLGKARNGPDTYKSLSGHEEFESWLASGLQAINAVTKLKIGNAINEQMGEQTIVDHK